MMTSKSIVTQMESDIVTQRSKKLVEVNKKELNEALEKIVPKVDNTWIVTFRQTCPGTKHDPIGNGRFFVAHCVEDALQQFTEWANDRGLSVSDIYAVALSQMVQRQLEDKNWKSPEDL